MESTERVSNVLLAFTAGQAALGVTEIAKQLGMPKSAVHRTLTSLCRSGLVRRENGTTKYRLGLRAVDLGLAALNQGDIREAALPHLEGATEETEETTTLSLLAGRQRFYAAQVESPHDVRMTVEIGLRCPLYAGASGRAILAAFDEAALEEYLRVTPLVALTDSTIVEADRLRDDLDEVRARGWAAGIGERDPWAASVAAAFRDRDGQVIGSLSVCGPIGRFDPAAIERHAAVIVRASEQLTTDLGAQPALVT
jgi:DNA-binding IclR family transcriptional regulator